MRKSFLSRLKLAQRLGLLLSLALFMVLGLAGGFISYWLSERIEQRAISGMAQTNRQAIDTISAYASALEGNVESSTAQLASQLSANLRLDAGKTVSSNGVNAPVLLAGEQVLNNDETLVDRYSQATRHVATVFVRDGEDFVRVASSLRKPDGSRTIGTRLDRDHPAYALLRSGQAYTGPVRLFEHDYMTRYLPLKDASGQVVAALFTGIDFTDGLKVLKEKILSLKIGDTGYVYVLDARKQPGELRVHPTAEGKQMLETTDADGQPFIKQMLERKQGEVRYMWLDQGSTKPREKLATFMSFERWGWLVATSAYQDELVKEPHEMQIRMFFGTLAVIALLVMIIFIAMRRWVSRPLSRLVGNTRKLAAGDLTVNIEVTRHDEIGEVLHANNEMAAALRQLISEVNQGAAGLARNARDLAALSDDVSQSSQAQSAAVSSMAASVEEMTHSISQVNQNANSARMLAEQSDTVSRSGEIVVGRTVQTMREIAAVSDSTSDTVTRLGEHTEQISRVVTVIRDIADQTNLLALNAAIEAARAGEMGRGFAVVADEVRKLAERTTQSTIEITDTVQRIQNESRHAVESMNSSVLQVEAGVQAAGEAGNSLGSIRDTARQVGEAVSGIADALREQSAASLDIAHNVERVAQQADHNHQKASDASLAACEMTTLAEQLSHSVARFRV